MFRGDLDNEVRTFRDASESAGLFARNKNTQTLLWRFSKSWQIDYFLLRQLPSLKSVCVHVYDNMRAILMTSIFFCIYNLYFFFYCNLVLTIIYFILHCLTLILDSVEFNLVIIFAACIASEYFTYILNIYTQYVLPHVSSSINWQKDQS